LQLVCRELINSIIGFYRRMKRFDFIYTLIDFECKKVNGQGQGLEIGANMYVDYWWRT